MSVLGRPIKQKDPVRGFVDACKQNADEHRKANGQTADASAPRQDSYISPTRDSPPISKIDLGSGLVHIPAEYAPDEPEEMPDDAIDLEVELTEEDNFANTPEYRALVHVDAPDLEHIVNPDVLELDYSDILASADLKKPEAVKAMKDVLYEDILSRRSEIGIYVTYTKKGSSQPLYIRKDGDNPAKRVSKDYVKSAVEALLQYDSSMEKGDWKSLKEASSIVSKYFTKDVKYKTLEMIEQKLDQEAMVLADDTIAGLVDKEDISEVYSRLRKTGLPLYLGKAVTIAEKYLGESVAAVTRLEYDAAVERSKKKASS